MGDGIVDRGSSGVLQSRDAKGRYGQRAREEDKDVELRDEREPEPRTIKRSRLPTQANRSTRGPEVIG
jgi:hypothetical protein